MQPLPTLFLLEKCYIIHYMKTKSNVNDTGVYVLHYSFKIQII